MSASQVSRRSSEVDLNYLGLRKFERGDRNSLKPSTAESVERRLLSVMKRVVIPVW